MRRVLLLLLAALPLAAQVATTNATRLRGKPVCAGLNPQAGHVLRWDGANSCWTTGAAGAQVLSGGGGSSSVGAGPDTTWYFTLSGVSTANANEAARQAVVARAGTLSKLYVVTSGAQHGSGNMVCTVRVNGVNTNLKVTVTAGAAAQTWADGTNTAAVTAGALVALGCENDATSPSATITGVGVLLE
jgi:hypothetical protein